jgi:hypothetical protein
MVSDHERFFIGTTRFNNDTFAENSNWRHKHNHEGCIYALNKRIPSHIPTDTLIYVLEMNNDENKIMGIGLIRNKRDTQQRIRIYHDNPYYNRYIYHSNQRIAAADVEHQKLLKLMEKLIFKGSRHMKRGQGITCIPWKRFKKGKTRKIIRLFFQSMF